MINTPSFIRLTVDLCVCYLFLPARMQVSCKKALSANARKVLKSPLLLPKSRPFVGSIHVQSLFHSRWNGFQKTNHRENHLVIFLPIQGSKSHPSVAPSRGPVWRRPVLRAPAPAASPVQGMWDDFWLKIACPFLFWFSPVYCQLYAAWLGRGTMGNIHPSQI